MTHEQDTRARLKREGDAGNYVMFRSGNSPQPWLGLFDVHLQRWVLVSPKTGTMTLTLDQLVAVGFSDYMLVSIDGLEHSR